MDDKVKIRKAIRKKRRQLETVERFQLNENLLKNALDIIDKNQPKSIAIYFPNDGEADLCNLVEYANFKDITLYLPVLHPIIKRGLWFANYNQNEMLYTNRFGIYEPFFNLDSLKAPWEMDLVFMPLVAFDLNGNRIGMGGGFYDYTFQFKSNVNTPTLVGCAYEFQQIDQCPNEHWDMPVDGILTDAKARWF
ncbi:5-formyltetrahydrofolate cyclo-ligase [Thiotrichales bacterium 19X7-9]|nr:5-formyltetrahydrofolate cyclo-ligase [Thiotrichales bacterium 19X7-9]TNF65393.1 MAG: 5-formyltetrahydrofolate cyclo-ligase [Gammaproteobacteria bacterium]UTW41816.1 5-formyltetrahydrofolate cyclo-ligase [bacterium SCSIO 12844]